jgi:poly-gamma-glutamate capsule biosynthesis protein CapA/YwtB (metallophosphatase superfamily)
MDQVFREEVVLSKSLTLNWLMCLLFCFPAWGQTRGDLIEDFDSGTPVLASYPDQDQDPDDWQVTASNAFGGSGSSLRIFGNSWKTQAIAPVAVADSTVWQVAIYCENRGEMQALGVSDGQNELFYTFFGTDLPEDTNWYTVYQGAFSRNQWHQYLLPIGRDWEIRFGYVPDVTGLIYVNDADSGSTGITLFDAIADVTTDLPRAPQARILYTVAEQRQVSEKLYRLAVEFRGEVFDPDSETHTWAWDFGDSTVSDLQNPQHEFLVHADYPYTVGLRVTDPDGLAAGDTCQITVATGDPEEPLTVNFVGDVFTGRGYENNGGLIDTYGIEGLYAPTLDIFGRAADVNVANLEVSYTDRGTPHPTKSVVFRSEPENITGLTYAGIDVVTLGNNHITDYGEIGMLDTMDGLEQLNIRYSGAGSSEYMALLPTFWTEKGVRVGFLGLCNRTGRKWNYQPFLDAGYDKPGFGYLLPDQLASSIAYSRPLADIVIVQTHSGDEYETAPPPGLKGGSGFAGPPRVEVAEIGAGDPDFKFKVEPSPGERELRRHAIDMGADILINHHPHVLQGFESYDGKFIAHSLGNFIFDLYYTETMPTMVLTLEIEKTGITGYRFTPAWINHWIPEPATGNLGREIVGRLADYSRSMNAIVVPIPDSNEARIHLSRADFDSTIIVTEVALPLVEIDGYAISEPLSLAGQGNLSQVGGLPDGGPWEVRWGREILWHGGFEDEGADLWDVNSDDEVLVTDVTHGGARSLRLRRMSNDVGQTGTDLEKHLPCDPSKQHSAVAWFRADNAHQARAMVRYYDSRYSESPLGDYDLDSRFDGSTEWVRQWRDLETPSNATYFEMRCGHEPPSGGTGYSWYDDLAFIEWERWEAGEDDLKIGAPNNYRFLQIRSADTGAGQVVVSYGETAYGSGPVSGSPEEIPAVAKLGLHCFPNPFNPRVTIELKMAITAASEVTIEVFDVRGRKVRTLHKGPLPIGIRHGLTWDGQDDSGRALASGVYLVQAKAGERQVGQKVTLIR